MRTLFAFCSVACLISTSTYAKDIPVLPPLNSVTLPPPVGPFLLVEWNVLDVAVRRGSIRGEYAAMDGVAFGLSTSYQDYSEDGWKQKVVQLGTSVSQYYQSLSLRGIFLRGEAGFLIAQFENSGVVPADQVAQGRTVGACFELVSGYRFVLWQHLSLAPAIGVRRLVPDFFFMHEGQQGRTFAVHEKVWQPRVDFSVGFGF